MNKSFDKITMEDRRNIFCINPRRGENDADINIDGTRLYFRDRLHCPHHEFGNNYYRSIRHIGFINSCGLDSVPEGRSCSM